MQEKLENVLSKGGKQEYLNYSKLNGTRPKCRVFGKKWEKSLECNQDSICNNDSVCALKLSDWKMHQEKKE